MRPETLILYVKLAAITLACTLLIGGVIDWAGYWFVMWAVSMATWLSMQRVVRSQGEMLDQMFGSMRHAVRCAGCHTAALLMSPPRVDDDDQPVVQLPPDWTMQDERPYCPRCVAKVR